MSKPFRDLQYAMPAAAPEACTKRIPHSTPPEALTEALDGEWEAALLDPPSMAKAPTPPEAEPRSSRALMAAKSASRAAVAARARQLNTKSAGLVRLTALPPAQRR